MKLADFVGGNQIDGISYTFMDYLELADWTGRPVREDKTGCIPQGEPKILEILGINPDTWQKTVNQFSEHAYSHIGTAEQIMAVCEISGKKWIAGIRSCRQLF